MEDQSTIIKMSSDAKLEAEKNNQETAKWQSDNEKIRADAAVERQRKEEESTQKTIDFFSVLQNDIQKTDNAYVKSTNKIIKSNNEIGASIVVATNGEKGWVEQALVSTGFENELADARKEHIQIQKENFVVVSQNKDAIKDSTDAKQKEVEAINDSIDAKKEELNSLEAQSQAYDDIVKAMDAMNNSIVEQAKLQNQNVLTAISGINQQLNSYSDFSDILDKLNNGGMSFLETLQAVGKNPDLIAAIDLQNEGLTFSKDKIEEIRKAKIQETIDFLKGERAKLTAINTMAQYELGLIKNISAEDTKAAQIALESYKDEGESLNDLYTAEEKLQQLKLDDVKQFTDEYTKMSNEIDRQNQEVAKNNPNIDPTLIKGPVGITSKYVGAKATTGGSAYGTTGQTFKEKYGEGAYTIPGVGVYSPTTGKIDYYPTPNKVMATGAERSYALALGIDPTGMTSKQVWQAIEKKTAEDGLKLDKLVLEANQNLEQAMNELGAGKAGSESVQELNDTLEKFYNTLREIDNLQQDMSSIQARIDLEKTGAEEDISLLKEKAGVLNDLINSQEYLNSERKKELDKMKDQLSKYSEFLYFEGEVLKVRQASLSLALVTGAMTQEQYDDTVNFLQQYTEMFGQIRNTEQEILDLQKEREAMYDDIVNGAIETRQRIYDAILETDQKELESAKEKFDQMTNMENDYLNAVKNAIDEQRKAREDATKQEDLIAKKRRLAILQRETSGLYGTEIATLQKEIAIAQQEARDTAVDKQLTALEEQMKIQQEQRDLQMQMLDEQQRAREESGYYWDRVDDTIKSGPSAILDALKSSSEYGGADPLSQREQLNEMREASKGIFELWKSGGKLDDVSKAIVEAANNIVANRMSEFSAGNGEDQGDQVPPGAPPPNTPPKEDPKIGQSVTIDGYGAASSDGSGTRAKNSGSGTVTNIKSGAKYPYLVSRNGVPIGWYPKESFVGYSKGGIVDYTGPAMVHGSSSNPEAFLNAKQTEMFAQMRDSLEQSRSLALKTGQTGISASTSIGDIIINLQNPINASAEAVAALVKKDILNSIQNRVSMTIQNVR